MNAQNLDEFYQVFCRLGLAALVGGLLGIDRDLHRKPAGIRVLALVSLGGAAISMVSLIVTDTGTGVVNDGVLRTVQGVLSGIGFLGAGVIMHARDEDEVHGITTAAAIWIAAISGMIFGMGQWILGLWTFVLTWVIIVCGRWLEKLVIKSGRPAIHHHHHHDQTEPSDH